MCLVANQNVSVDDAVFDIPDEEIPYTKYDRFLESADNLLRKQKRRLRGKYKERRYIP